ncbi:MAG TPA: GNAT family N-acetyltransferase [Thermomicrobiales bacterium]|nr:GNAT family N-acetyltransferase [Thermomicrobiales bacterium]
MILQTPRLTLRELDPADLDFVAAMLAHPEVMRYWPRCYTRAEAEDWITRQQARYAQDGFGYWLVVERATGQPVGQAGLLALTVDGRADTALGYILHRPCWGRGFATEAGAACLDYAFTTLGQPRVIAPIRPENTPSRAVAARLGLREGPATFYAGFTHLIFAITQAEQHSAGKPSSSQP